MSDEMRDFILRWLDTSGRTLELRTGRAFRAAGANVVRQSYEYTDVKTSSLREGDVLAMFGWTGPGELPCTISAVVECKSSTKKPWVAFYDRSVKWPHTITDVVPYAHAPYTDALKSLDSDFLDVDVFAERSVATSIAAVQENESANAANYAADAVRQVLSATAGLRQAHIDSFNDDKRGLVLVPMVVTSTPLFSCRLDTAGEVELEPVDLLVVHAAWQDRQARVLVLHETEVPTVADQLRALANRAHLG